MKKENRSFIEILSNNSVSLVFIILGLICLIIAYKLPNIIKNY